MPSWTPEQLREYELKLRSKVQGAKPEPAIQNEPLGKGEGKAQGPPRITVSLKCFRQKLLDPDNLCPKGLIDGLRYAGLIPDDSPKEIKLVVEQDECGKGEDRTEVNIDYDC